MTQEKHENPVSGARAAAAGVLDDSSVSADRRAARDARLLGSFPLTSSGQGEECWQLML